MQKIQEIKLGVASVIILAILGYFIFFNKPDTFEGTYYPEGCLTCEDSYIFSPEFETEFKCISWAQDQRKYRDNLGLDTSHDRAECGKNCKWERPSGQSQFLVCEETFDIPSDMR